MSTKSRKKLLPFQRRLPPEQRKFERFAAELETQRSCGECTACCDAIAVEEIHKPEFTPCQHLCKVGGCAIYRNRPGQCREYMCGWKAIWTPNDEMWRPDNLGVIFDVHERGMGGRFAIRCWQLRSETQILDDPDVRRMAWALSFQSRYPLVARFGDVLNISVHLVAGLDRIRDDLSVSVPDVPVYRLTHDVITDPLDFDKKREAPPDDELQDMADQFGLRAFKQQMKL